jgi:hypothetical protein
MMAEFPVAFEMRFVEKLIRRGRMGKFSMTLPEFGNIDRLIVCNGRLDIDKRSRLGFFGVPNATD